MAARKSNIHPAPARPELDQLLKDAIKSPVSEEQLQRQRASFAYGNASAGAELITKSTAQKAASSHRLITAAD
jgi:hypothetical protein